jgi:hypothetical protein
MPSANPYLGYTPPEPSDDLVVVAAKALDLIRLIVTDQMNLRDQLLREFAAKAASAGES